MIKLIATDMDGTLLNEAGQLPDGFIDLLNRLLQKNICFVIASGRSYYDLKDFFEEATPYLDFICDNGAFVVSRHHQRQMSLLEKKAIDDILLQCESITHIKVILSGPNGMYATPCENEFEEILAHYFSNIQVVSNLQDIHDPIHRICICDLNHPLQNSYPILSNRFGSHFKVTLSGDIWLDITNLEVNKGNALSKIQSLLHINQDETMVFGDYYNDIEMLKVAKYSFVMANANEDMFSHGNYTAKSHNENGVCEAINEFIFKSKLK